MRTLPCLFLVACTKPVETGVDSDTPVDTDSPVDTDPADTDTADTDPFEPDPDCTDYEPWSDVVLSCSGEPTRVWKMVSLSHPYDGTCEPYFADESGGQWATSEDAYTELTCDLDCVYDHTGAGDLVYCEYKGGFEMYDVGGEGQVGDGAACEDLVFVNTCAGSAYATTIEAYQAAFPCEDHLDTCPPR